MSVVLPTNWWNRQSSWTQIYKNSYDWNTNVIPKTSPKSNPSSSETKKSLITIFFGQCDEATQTETALWDNYTDDRDEGRLLAFIEQLPAVCFGGDNGGLSYAPYKQVVAIKALYIYTNNEVNDPHGFKEKVKIKYKSTKAIVKNSQTGPQP